MNRQTMFAMAVAALLVFAYASVIDTITADPLTWIRPFLALVAGLSMLPGVMIVGLVYALSGMDMTTVADGPMHIVAASALGWLAAAAVARRRTARRA